MQQVQPPALSYPPAQACDAEDDFFGQRVKDPYRWLEDAESQAAIDWVSAQNALTESFVATPVRERIRARLTEVWNYARLSVPERKGDWYFCWKNDGLQNQEVLLRLRELDGPAECVLDPNQLCSDGHLAVNSCAISRDGKWLAYGLSENGSDSETLHFRDLESGTEFEDRVHGLHNSAVAWMPDGSGVVYNSYPLANQPGAAQHSHNQVWLHRLGTSQSEDLLLYEDPSHPELDFFPTISEDGHWLLLHSHIGASLDNGIIFCPLYPNAPPPGPDAFVTLMRAGESQYVFIDNDGPQLYFLTNDQAPRKSLIAVDARRPDPDYWREIIAQEDQILERVISAGGHFVTCWLQDACHRLKIHARNGTCLREIPLPAPGTVLLSGHRNELQLFFSFSSFVTPAMVYAYQLETGAMRLIRRSEARIEPRDYVTRQEFVSSRDGTRIPVFLVHKKGIEPDGQLPLLLTGYGGFGLSQLPRFALEQVPWFEAGGVFAVANLRGGAEYGEDWHQQGMRDKKQNVFDDFIAVGEWLIQQGWCHPRKLAILGDSNGGLLTAACLAQRPDLYGAVISQVPLIDMLRYHRFSVGRYWIPEYGCAEHSAAQFKTIFAYSPLHNLKPVAYPPTLVMSGEGDDRVLPAHAKKFIAALQAVSTGSEPHLLRIEPKAGHGAGKPTAKRIAGLADMYAFLFKVLNIQT